MLKIVHISGTEPAQPKKLTAKQRKDIELAEFSERMRRKREKAALKMTEKLKTLLK